MTYKIGFCSCSKSCIICVDFRQKHSLKFAQFRVRVTNKKGFFYSILY
jgi:hypothetical protein